jgi:hypothetical protein
MTQKIPEQKDLVLSVRTVDDDSRKLNANAIGSFDKTTMGEEAEVIATKSLWTTTVEYLGKARASTMVKLGDTQTTTMESMGKAKGKYFPSDMVANTPEDAMCEFKIMIGEAKAHEKSGGEKWDLPWSPLKELDSTVDEVLAAFLLWSRVEDLEGGAIPGEVLMNVSKAFRRYHTYVDWMSKNQDMLKEPLTGASVARAAKAFGTKISHDKTGRLVWWLDVKKMDLDAFHNQDIPVEETVRFLAWAVHVIMLDKSAQENGMVYVQDLDSIGFLKVIGAFPLSTVCAKLESLTSGCLPIKMKALYVMQPSSWASVLLALMRSFMSAKMRSRIIKVGAEENAQEIIAEAVGGTDFIPHACCNLEGTLELDIIFGKYIKE